MDQSSSPTSKSTAAYLANKESETGIKCILINETYVKLPYASAMNLCAFGLLKRALGKRQIKTLNGLDDKSSSTLPSTVPATPHPSQQGTSEQSSKLQVRFTEPPAQYVARSGSVIQPSRRFL
ncbi:hypothetical protein TNCV_2166781 [Trichonephila clavipes]|nr:hypothetical protein TNCV_2166781 [Trichonephila clavipes]